MKLKKMLPSCSPQKAILPFQLLVRFAESSSIFATGYGAQDEYNNTHKVARRTAGQRTTAARPSYYTGHPTHRKEVKFMVTSTPFAARIRFVDSERRSIQTLTRLRPNLMPMQLTALRTIVNNLRSDSHQTTGGYYTVMDELRQA